MPNPNAGPAPVVVLQSVRLDAPEPSYMNFVADEISRRGDVRLISFSYRAALFGSWHILHVHWPEDLLRFGGRLRRAFTYLLFLALVMRLRLTRRAVVRTVHNLHPHVRGSPIESWLLTLLNTQNTAYVTLNPFSPIPVDGASKTLIPHGHYRHLIERCAAGASRSPTSFTLLFFGFVKPYKGVETLVEAFREIHGPELGLRIMGRATENLREQLQRAERADGRLTVRSDFLTPSELSDELLGSDLVVLPYLAGHNSGAILHALSADRPVLVPDTEVHRWIASETGPGWVLTFEPPLTASALSRAIAACRSVKRSKSPNLVDREWSVVADRYIDVYHSTTCALARPANDVRS